MPRRTLQGCGGGGVCPAGSQSPEGTVEDRLEILASSQRGQWGPSLWVEVQVPGPGDSGMRLPKDMEFMAGGGLRAGHKLRVQL